MVTSTIKYILVAIPPIPPVAAAYQNDVQSMRGVDDIIKSKVDGIRSALKQRGNNINATQESYKKYKKTNRRRGLIGCINIGITRFKLSWGHF